MNKTVLLVEDDLTWGDLLTSVLNKRGYTVAWFVRARRGQDGNLILMDADGKESRLAAEPYALAMVDGRLRGSQLNGPEVVPHVVAAGNKVLAISGDRHFNQQMIFAGAYSAVPKFDLFEAVLKGTIKFD